MTSATDLSPQRAIFAAEYALRSSAKEAAIAAGYSTHTAKQTGYKLLQNDAVRERIDYLTSRRQLEIAYTAEQWRKDVLGDITAAKTAGNHSAVMKGRELLGRHIGAMNDHKNLNSQQAEFFTYLGSAMEQFKRELNNAENHPNSLEARSRIVQ